MGSILITASSSTDDLIRALHHLGEEYQVYKSILIKHKLTGAILKKISKETDFLLYCRKIGVKDSRHMKTFQKYLTKISWIHSIQEEFPSFEEKARVFISHTWENRTDLDEKVNVIRSTMHQNGVHTFDLGEEHIIA